MKDWFDNLEQREQWMVGAGGIVVAVILFWLLIWSPLDKGQRDLEASVALWQSSLADLRGIAAQGDASSGSAPTQAAGANQSPVVIVDQTLRERNLNSAVQRRQPIPSGIRVEFEDVAFDQLVVWLGDLNARYGMVVQAGSMQIASRSEAGLINASVTLERAQ